MALADLDSLAGAVEAEDRDPVGRPREDLKIEDVVLVRDGADRVEAEIALGFERVLLEVLRLVFLPVLVDPSLII